MINSTVRRCVVVIAVGIVTSACQNSTGPSHSRVNGQVTHPTGDSLITLGLSGRPHGVAFASSGEFCVSQIDGNSITCGMLGAPPATPVFDSHAIAVGNTPAHVALSPTGDRAFTADQSGATMSVVDVSTRQSVGSVPLSDGGFNLLVSPDGARVYVTTASGTLHIIDTGTLKVITTVPVGAAANGLAYDANRNTLYVSSIDAGTITALNTAINAVTNTFTVGGGPQRIALSADGGELYVASQQYGLQVLTLADGSVSMVPGIQPGSVGLALSPDNAQLYVTNPPAGVVYIVDRASRQVVDSLTNFGSPRNVAFDPTGATAVITDEMGYVRFVR